MSIPVNVNFNKIEKHQLAFCGILSYSTLALLVGDVSLFLFMVPAWYLLGVQLFPTFFSRFPLKPGRAFFIGYLFYVFILILLIGEDSFVFLELPVLYFVGYKLLPRYLLKERFNPKRAFFGGSLFILCINLVTYSIYALVLVLFYIYKYFFTAQSKSLLEMATIFIDPYLSVLDKLDIYSLSIIGMTILAGFLVPLIIGGASIIPLAYLIPRYYATQSSSSLSPSISKTT